MPRQRRIMVRLKVEFLWERLALLQHSQNWLAQQVGITPTYLSMLIRSGRAPSGRIRRRMQEVLRADDFHDLFELEGRYDSE